MIAWRIHTNALVEAGYGVRDAAWVFSKGAKHEELVRNLRDLLEQATIGRFSRASTLLGSGNSIPASLKTAQPQVDLATHGSKCPYCGAAVPRTRLTCDECKAYRIRDRVFPKEQSYVFPDPIEPRQSEGQS